MSFKENQQPTRGFGLLENYLTKKRTHQANALIPESFRQGRLLDIGCGMYPYFLLNTEFNEKYGIDQASDFTQSPTQTPSGQSIQLKKWDFGHQTGLPFDSEFFDVVTMLAVFEHIETNQSQQLAWEIHRVLKKGGVFIMTTTAPWAKSLPRLLARLRLVSPVEVYDHKETNSHKKIIHILEDSGFKKRISHRAILKYS